MLNAEDKGDFFVARTAQGDFLVRIEDLRSMGFKDPAGAVTLIEGEPFLSLRSMPGVSFSFEQKTLELKIVAEPRLLPSQSLSGNAGRWRRGKRVEGSSGFLNYGLDSTQSDSGPALTTFTGEFGWSRGDSLFLTDAISTRNSDGRHRLVRLSSSLTRDDVGQLRRTVIGDFSTPSRELGNGVLMGGYSLSKLFALNPYVVQFPTQTVSGTVALPSDLELYVDGQRIRSEKLRPGEFELRDILAYGGARSVQVLLRDPFGRVQQLDYSFYFSDQPLRKGLHEYSYNIGALRRRYGSASANYGPPATSIFHRYGVTNAVTLGLRAEAMRGFLNAGPLATVVLGSAGVVNIGVAASEVQGRHGAGASAAYNYLTRRWSLALAARRDSRDYATLGDPPAFSLRKYETTAVATYNLPGSGAISLSHSARSFRSSSPAAASPVPSVFALPDRQRITALSYTTPLVSGRASLTASIRRITDTQPRTELSIRLIVFLGRDYSVIGSYQGSTAGHTADLQLTKAQPIGEGVGFVIDASQTSDASVKQWGGRSTIQYNAPAAIVRGEYGRRGQGGAGTSTDTRVSLAGGIAYAGGQMAVGRPVTGSFGIVKVGELADVSVSANGQPMGKTNSSGLLFVPTLNPYYNNEIVISPETVPIEYSLPAARQVIVPPARGGGLINFPAHRVQAVTGRIQLEENGSVTPVEFRSVTLTGNGASYMLKTARDGEFYIENLKLGRYQGTANVPGKECRFELNVPNSTETVQEIGMVTCRAAP